MLTTAHCQDIPPWLHLWLNDVRPGWGKVVNPPVGYVMPNVAASNVRIWTDPRDAAYISRGREGGRDFVRDMYPRWSQNPATAYSLWNEPDVNTNQGLANLNEATIGAVDEGLHLQIPLVVGEWPEGNSHDNDLNDPGVSAWKIAQLRPSIKAAADAGMWFGRHCYFRPFVEGPTGRWHALGRLAWDLEQLNIPNLKTLVTEWGIDGGIAGHTGEQGWQKLDTGAVSTEQYIAWLVDGEKYARTLPGVEALMIYGFGATDKWLAGGFDIPESFARSLVGPLKAIEVPADPPEYAGTHLRIELARPLDYVPGISDVVTQWFGEGVGNYSKYGLYAHNGIDYRSRGARPVKAMHSGIARVYDQGSIGLGKYVKIDYLDGRGVKRYDTRSAHLSEWGIHDGTKVKRGQVIGKSGSTGNSTAEHLHVDLLVDGISNPGYGDRIDFSPWRTV